MRSIGIVGGTVRPKRAFAAVLLAALATAVCIWFSGSAVASSPCSDDFTGPSGGAWGLAANWTSPEDSSEHALPGKEDVVCLEGTTVDVAAGGAVADSMLRERGPAVSL